MVASSLLRLGDTRRDDSYPLTAQGTGHSKEPILDHAEQNESVLSVILPPILAGNGKDVIERKSRRLEAHAVTGKVLGCFTVVAFEILVLHKLRLSRNWR
jgi:hypothetical protein